VCAIVDEGALRCWGSNTDGELGRGVQSPTELPAPVVGISGVEDVALGADHACARTAGGDTYCWGSNANGQLGDGTKERRLKPTRVAW
jgi:alpha-tubulin suppressor-like RCC1 family protein